jgi:hypothetical protein
MSNISISQPLRLVRETGLTDSELTRISDIKLKRELKSIKLSWSAFEMIGSLSGSNNLSRLSDLALSNSQFALGQYSIFVGRAEDVREINDNVNLASGLNLRCNPKVSLFRCLNNKQDAILVLEWPTALTNLVKVDDILGDTHKPDYLSFAADMRKLLEVNRFHEYALIGSAHHYVDRTEKYPYIVVDVWNSFKRPNPDEVGRIKSKIDSLERR